MDAETLDLDEFAELLGVTEKAVRDWIGEGMPVTRRGTRGGQREKTRIALRPAIRWYFASNHEGLQLDRQRSRLAQEQADKFALENAERRGDLARISVLEKSFADAVAVAQALLLAIPTKEAPMLVPLNDANAIENRLNQAINDALQQLAAYGARGTGERKRGGRPGNGALRTPTPAERKRVGRGKPLPQ